MKRSPEKTREPQYRCVLEVRDREGVARLGLMANQMWHDDPRALLFHLARYKFVAKMLAGCGKVLEVGCADAFASRLVAQSVGRLTATDFDPLFIRDAEARKSRCWPVEYRVHDILDGPVPGRFDAAYALDVLEHVPRRQERRFLDHLAASLLPDGVLILGTPSRESQVHASPASRAGHVNCQTGEELRRLLGRRFTRVFLFSMNDEVVHTGFSPMAHYLLALATGRRRRR